METGFPSPAQGYEQPNIDLAHYLIPRTASTFLMRIATSRYQSIGIFDGDILIIDRSLSPKDGNLSVASNEQGFFCFVWHSKTTNKYEDSLFFGVVTFVIHNTLQKES